MINKASIYSLIVNKTINFEKTNDELMNMIMREKYHFEKNEKKKQFDTKDTLLVKLYWNYIDLCFTY